MVGAASIASDDRANGGSALLSNSSLKVCRMTHSKPETPSNGPHDERLGKETEVMEELGGLEESDDMGELPPMLPLRGRHLAVSDRGTVGLAQEPASTLRVGDRPTEATDYENFPKLPGYKILRVLGRGGMGVVYLAEDQRLGRQVAIKMVVFETPNQEARARFRSEGQLLASIDHPGVAKVYEVAFAAERPFLIMEFIDGQTLSELAGGRPLAAKVAADFAAQLALALHACHQKQIIHRDVKPSNALVNREGRLKLTDFGLAKLTGQESRSRITQTGDVMGTPSYMSPEQASGVVNHLGPRSDVYSVGAVLYELVTGRPPFTSPEPLQTVLMVLGNQPVPARTLLPRLCPDLDNIILKCLEKSPSHRYASCQELADDLHRYLNREPVQAKPVPWRRKMFFWLKQHPALSTAMALSLLLVISALLGFGIHTSRLQAELERTKRMVANGRDFSRWLLYDFSAAMESDQGLTGLRKQLAEKSAEHLEKMSAEMAGDPQLRRVIADSQIRLSQVQLALGELEQARTSLQQALQSVPIDENRRTVDEVAIWILATIRNAEIDFELQQTTAGAQGLVLARKAMQQNRDRLEPSIYQELFAALSLAEVQLASRRGDLAKLEQLITELDATGLRPDPRNATVAEELAWLVPIWVAKGTLLIRLGETEKLLEELMPVLSGIKERMKLEAQPLSVRVQLASLERFLADALFQQGDLENALVLYKKQQELWAKVLEGDPENLVTLFNLALAWQHQSDCHLLQSQLDEAKLALDQAFETLERFSKWSGAAWQDNPETLHYYGSLATWHQLSGDPAESIRLNELFIEKLQPFAQDNVLYQQMLGESLLSIGLAQALLYTATSETDDLRELKEAYRKAQNTFQKAHDHFLDMQQRGVLSPQGLLHKDNAAEMRIYLSEMHQKLLATHGEIH